MKSYGSNFQIHVPVGSNREAFAIVSFNGGHRFRFCLKTSEKDTTDVSLNFYPVGTTTTLEDNQEFLCNLLKL